MRKCDGLTGSTTKTQKESQEDQWELKHRGGGGPPLAFLPFPGSWPSLWLFPDLPVNPSHLLVLKLVLRWKPQAGQVVQELLEALVHQAAQWSQPLLGVVSGCLTQADLFLKSMLPINRKINSCSNFVGRIFVRFLLFLIMLFVGLIMH